MNKTLQSALLIVGVSCLACTNPTTQHEQKQKVDSTATKTTTIMKSLVSIVEIPATDLSRAITFYQSVLGITIEEVEMGGTQMGVFPSDEQSASVVLVKGEEYKPATSGAVVYFNAGTDLQPTLDKVEPNGGKVLVPKTEISPEMDFFALFMDSEGNKLGLHSTH